MIGARAVALGFAATGALGCAGAGWPDEPGVAVTVSHVQNVRAVETFVASLTARRLGKAVPQPIVAPSRQWGLRPIAERLQVGSLSAPQARLASLAWGRSAYHRDVDVWLLDCSAGRDLSLPSALVDRPTAVISYASAHFRPRSAGAEQCAIIVVAATGADVVTMQPLNAP